MDDTTNDKTALLRGVLAPWDERAWENFRDAHPEAASYLLDLVGIGGTNRDIRDYCEDEGYSRRVADWLVHAAEHLRRSTQTTDNDVQPRRFQEGQIGEPKAGKVTWEKKTTGGTRPASAYPPTVPSGR